jgi:hypothetical protein
MAYGGSATASGSNTTSLAVTITPPNGSCILLIASENNESTRTLTWPSGFTQQGYANETTLNDAGVSVVTYVAMKAVASSEPGSYTVSGFAPSRGVSIICAYWTGRSSSPTLVTNFQSNVGSSSSTTIAETLAGVTANANDDVAAFFGTAGSAGAGSCTFSGITSGYTNQANVMTGDNFCNLLLVTKDNVSSGATGSVAASVTNTSWTGGGDYYGIVLSIPAGGGSPTYQPLPYIRPVLLEF